MDSAQDENGLSRVVDFKENPVVAEPEPVGFVSVQLLDAERAGILFKGEQFSGGFVKRFTWKRVEFFLSRALEDNLIGHEEWRWNRWAR